MEITKFDAIQTFFVDSSAINNSGEAFLTSIDLFFKNKPSTASITSSIYKPGVVISICEVENDIPLLNKIYDESVVRVEYDYIYTFNDASVSTSFVFSKPIIIKANRFYGIVVQYDEAGFEMWVNKQGDAIIGTNTPSPGINSTKDGKFFNGAVNTTNIQPLTNIDLKYKVNIAKFTANTMTVELVNKDYEFLTVNSISGSFVGGEYVFNNVANSVGNVAVVIGNSIIIGTNTTFDSLHAGDNIVILTSNNESNGTIFTVSEVVSNTILEITSKPMFSNSAAIYKAPVVGKVYDYDYVNKKLYLYESSANSVNYLEANNTLFGEYSEAQCTIEAINEFSVDRIVPQINVVSPSIGTFSGTFNFCYSNGSAYIIDTSKEKPLFKDAVNEISKYDGHVLSRSDEVLNSNLHDTIARKSAVTKITFNISSNTTSLYTSPYIDEEQIDFFVQQSNINSDYTVTVDGVEYDTEIEKNGIAPSKHFSKKVTFVNNRFAEDVRVFADIYRPANTDVKVYVKLHNSSDPEAFDDKSWTPLECIVNQEKYSSSEDRLDYVEYSFGLPKYSDVANVVTGTFKVESGNSVLIGSGVVVNNYVLPGDVVRVYDPLESNTNYFVAGVTTSNTTSITLNQTTANASVLGTGLKVDKLKYKNIAYNDPQNDNVCSYFNESLGKISKFDTMQFKIVFLADTTYKIPRVNSISVVGVSA